MKNFIKLVGLSILVLGVGQGCGRLIDEGIEKGLGPTAKAMPMDPQWPAADHAYLANYKNFVLGTITTEYPAVPPAFMAYLPESLTGQLTSKGLPRGQRGPTLVINIAILAYQPVSSYEKALGPTEEVVARVSLVDQASGKLVGQAVCIGRTYQSVGLGVKWKAWGLSRAIVNKWLDDYYPKAGRQETEEKAPSKE